MPYLYERRGASVKNNKTSRFSPLSFDLCTCHPSVAPDFYTFYDEQVRIRWIEGPLESSYLRKLNRDVSFLISKYNKLVIVCAKEGDASLRVCVCTFFLFNSRVKVTFTKNDYSSKVATKVGREKIINKRSIAVNHPPAVTRLPFFLRRRRRENSRSFMTFS